jgi:hypothetical protein
MVNTRPMKQLLILTLFFTSQVAAYAGGFRFPNVPYAYAKMHYFNIELEAPHMNQPSIYRDGIYAETKVGNGQIVSEEMHNEILNIFKHGADELVYGLSKCYLPHHGIIYYNDRHEPVASLSICFACDQIKIWSKEPIKFEDDYTKFDYPKAEKQMADLEKTFRKAGYLIYKRGDEWKQYAAHFDTLNHFESPDTLLFDAKKDTFDHVFFLHEPITLETHEQLMVSRWAPKLKLDQDTLMNTSEIFKTYSYGKDYVLTYKKGKNTGKLLSLEANGPHLVLPGGIRVGMSFEEVSRLLNDRLKMNPSEHIIIRSKQYHLSLTFHWQTLTQIKLDLI